MHAPLKYPQLRKGLVSLWSPGQTGRHPYLHDATNRLRLTPSGNATVVLDGGRYATTSDASNDYYTGNYGHNPCPGEFSIACWLWANTSTTGSYFGLGSNNSTRQAIHLRTRGSTWLQFGMYGDDFQCTSLSNLRLRWTHVVCQMLSDNTQEIWQDGALVGTRAAGGFFTGNGSLMLHHDAWNANSDWEGLLDDVALYRRSLTGDEICIMAQRRGVFFERQRMAFAIPTAAATTESHLTLLGVG